MTVNTDGPITLITSPKRRAGIIFTGEVVGLNLLRSIGLKWVDLVVQMPSSGDGKVSTHEYWSQILNHPKLGVYPQWGQKKNPLIMNEILMVVYK